ncbi:hypothetical protein niasHT_003923 [Heterodera trifolii]|uniref:Uncharacterized protein n=1 Tax=Heterodera trifolii TaxID=157864 RepID=A0ABD2LX27_9BILA
MFGIRPPSIPCQFLFVFSAFVARLRCQFSPQSYPDPRIDPLSCRLLLPSQVCDPSEILTPDERRILNEKIVRLQHITANIKNTSPACADTTKSTNLFIMVALVDRLSNALPFDGSSDHSANIEKFTNQLRSKYQHFQDISLCDPLVLIVNAHGDRQVFTVAGRDAKLSREVLQAAFQRNVGHFRGGNYALGLEGMAEYIVSAYGAAHIVQVPSFPGEPNTKKATKNNESFSNGPSAVSYGMGQFVAHGVRQQQRPITEKKFNIESIPEEDRLWTRILAKAMAQCGGEEQGKMVKYAQTVVEDAMDISLKLISDPHYNRIEEDSQSMENGPNAREKAWQSIKGHLEQIYAKYGGQMQQMNTAEQCPGPKRGEKTLKILRLN